MGKRSIEVDGAAVCSLAGGRRTAGWCVRTCLFPALLVICLGYACWPHRHCFLTGFAATCGALARRWLDVRDGIAVPDAAPWGWGRPERLFWFWKDACGVGRPTDGLYVVYVHGLG